MYQNQTGFYRYFSAWNGFFGPDRIFVLDRTGSEWTGFYLDQTGPERISFTIEPQQNFSTFPTF